MHGVLFLLALGPFQQTIKSAAATKQCVQPTENYSYRRSAKKETWAIILSFIVTRIIDWPPNQLSDL